MTFAIAKAVMKTEHTIVPFDLNWQRYFIGGDSDMLAAIISSIAEAYYGISLAIKEKALTYLDKDLHVIYDNWFHFVRRKYRTI